MKEKIDSSFYHRRASSDNAYNRKSLDKNDHVGQGEEMGKLNKEQQELLQIIKEATKIEGRLTKLEKIRIAQWAQKLSSRPNNAIWRKNIIFYLKVLEEMINQQDISTPFSTIPPEGSLPNLKMLDLPFPIRQRLTKKEQIGIQISNKAKSKQGSVERHNFKAKSINFNQDLKVDMINIDNSNIARNTKTRKPSIKSCQVSGKRQDSKVNATNLRLKLTDLNKQNNSLSINNSSVTRRLFENQTENENILLTYANQDNLHIHNATVCSFDNLDHNKSNKNRGLSLLLKVYEIIHKNADLDEDTQAITICSSISKIAEQMGVSLTNDNLNQSSISSSSVHFRKASENIRLKFVQTDQQTLEFMSFLHRFRVKNQ